MLHAVNRILDCRDLHEACDAILEVVSERLDARSGVAIELLGRPGAHAITAIAQRNIPRMVLQTYLDHEHASDPGIPLTLSMAREAPATAATSLRHAIFADHVEHDAFERSGFYRRFLAPNGVRHTAYLVFYPERPAAGLIGFGLHRGDGQRAFTSAEFRFLGELRPAIATSLNTIFLRRRIAALRTAAIRPAACAPPSRTQDGVLPLSPSQREVARMAASGLRNTEIAEERACSIRTVENHLRAVYERLNIHSRMQLVARYGAHLC